MQRRNNSPASDYARAISYNYSAVPAASGFSSPACFPLPPGFAASTASVIRHCTAAPAAVNAPGRAFAFPITGRNTARLIRPLQAAICFNFALFASVRHYSAAASICVFSKFARLPITAFTSAGFQQRSLLPSTPFSFQYSSPPIALLQYAISICPLQQLRATNSPASHRRGIGPFRHRDLGRASGPGIDFKLYAPLASTPFGSHAISGTGHYGLGHHGRGGFGRASPFPPASPRAAGRAGGHRTGTGGRFGRPGGHRSHTGASGSRRRPLGRRAGVGRGVRRASGRAGTGLGLPALRTGRSGHRQRRRAIIH